MFEVKRLSLINVRSTPKGRIIVDVNLGNYIPKIKLSTIIGVMLSLVLGFMIGVTIFSNPDSTLAVPSLVVGPRSGTNPTELSIPSQDASFAVTNTESISTFYKLPNAETAFVQTSARLAEGGATHITVGGRQDSKQLIMQAELGDKISLVGKNNGVYSFHVVSIFSLDKQELASIVQRPERLLVIIPQDFWQTQFTVIAAQ